MKEKKSEYEYKRPKETVTFRFADAVSQFEMGEVEEKKGNLPAAMNFYQMAMNLDPQQKAYEEAYRRVQKMIKQGK